MDLPYLITEAKDKKPYVGNYRLERRESSRIARLALEAISILGIRDYVRFDIRECGQGIAYPIDVNTGAFLVGRSFELACTALRGSPQQMFAAMVSQSWCRQMAQWRVD